jgi:copper transport protein
MSSTSRGGARVGLFARRAAVVLALGAVVCTLVASPASAHADLLESDPAPGAVLDSPPKTVTLSFTEPVDPRLGRARVFDADGKVIDTSADRPPAANVMRLKLPELDDGAYIVTWRVSGEDAHPVQGVFTFQVGSTANATSRELIALGDRLLNQGASSDRIVGVLYGISRWGVFAGLALLLGGAAFCAFVWPGGRTVGRARLIVASGWLLVVLATVAALLLYGPYAKARSLGDLFDADLIGDTLSTRSGTVWATRLGLLAFAVVPLRLLLSARERLPAWLFPVGAVLAVGLASTPGLAAHALVGDWVPAAVTSETIHVLAMSGWLGGLTMLAVVLVPGRAAAELREPLARFSRLALICISGVVATGAFQSWRQVGSLDGLRSTEYGRILVVKLVIVSAVIALAAFSREYVLRLTGGTDSRLTRRARVPVVAGGADNAAATDAAELRGLRRSVAGEMLLAVMVLAATALLVNSAPARGVIERGATDFVALTLEDEKASVDITVSPGRAGRNDVHVSVLGPDDQPLNVDQLSIRLIRPDGGGEKDVDPQPLDDNHYIAADEKLRPDGEWRVVIGLRLDGGARVRLADTLEIR